jgi:hypothetical protein
MKEGDSNYDYCHFFSSFLFVCEKEKGDGSYHHLHQWFCYKEGNDNKSSPFFLSA